MFGDRFIGVVAPAELGSYRRGKVERGDGEVVVDARGALVGLPVHDVAGEV